MMFLHAILGFWCLFAYNIISSDYHEVYMDILNFNNWPSQKIVKLSNDQDFMEMDQKLSSKLLSELHMITPNISTFNDPSEILAYYLAIHNLCLASAENINFYQFHQYFRSFYLNLHNNIEKEKKDVREDIVMKTINLNGDVHMKMVIKNRLNMLFNLAYGIKTLQDNLSHVYENYLSIININNISIDIKNVRLFIMNNNLSNSQLTKSVEQFFNTIVINYL